jgi:uncharacterized delta-60 repeat protein
MRKQLWSILAFTGLLIAGDLEELQKEVRLRQLYDFNPHLLPLHEALRLGSTSTSAANILLNGFGRTLAFSQHASASAGPNPRPQAYVVVAGFGYQYSPLIGSNLPNSTIQTAVNTQTAYAMLCMARYNWFTGQPDLTFNPAAKGVTGVPNTGFKGQVITDFGTNTFPLRLVIQYDPIEANQKIIVVGYAYLITTSPGTNQYGVFVAKYNWDGSLDTGFNSAGTTPGVVVTPVSTIPAQPNLFSGIVDQGFAVALQADNKIVVTGSASGQLFVVRYNNALTVPATAGTLDTSFNPAGFTYDFNKVIPTKTIGNTLPGIFICSILGRRTVNSTGLSLVGYDCGYAVAVQPDGKIVVAGTGASLIAPQNSSIFVSSVPTLTTNPTSRGPNQIILLRLTSTGVPDPTFGQLVQGSVASGVQTTKIVGFDDRAYALGLQPDGKIVVAGTSADVSLNYAIAVVRYTAQGVVDTTFGGYQFGSSSVVAPGPYGPVSLAGMVRLYVLNTVNSNCPFVVANALRIQPAPGNEIVVAGYNSYNISSNRFTMTVARLLPSGKLDLTFNATGIPQGYSPAYNPVPSNFTIPRQPGVQTISIQGQYDQAYDVAIQPAIPFPPAPYPPQPYKIAFVGSSWDTGATKQLYAFAFARLFLNGLVDSSLSATFTNKSLFHEQLVGEENGLEVMHQKHYFPMLTPECSITGEELCSSSE